MPIIVNDIEITDDEVHAEMQYHPASSVEAARHKAARALVIRQLLLQEAKAKKLLDAPEKAEVEQAEKTIDALDQKEVAVPRADRQSCKRYYERNPERFVDKRTHRLYRSKPSRLISETTYMPDHCERHRSIYRTSGGAGAYRGI